MEGLDITNYFPKDLYRRELPPRNLFEINKSNFLGINLTWIKDKSVPNDTIRFITDKEIVVITGIKD